MRRNFLSQEISEELQKVLPWPREVRNGEALETTFRFCMGNKPVLLHLSVVSASRGQLVEMQICSFPSRSLAVLIPGDEAEAPESAF